MHLLYRGGDSLFRRLHKRAEREAVRIYWLTDAHYDYLVEGDPDAPGAVGGTRLFYTAGSKIRHFVDLVNAAEPEAALCTGDLIDKRTQSIAEALDIWDDIDPGVPRFFTIGNHDLSTGPTYADWVSALGYGGRDVNAGSVFNYSTSVVRGGFAIRLITMDTNILAGTHQQILEGRLDSNALDWLANELDTCPESVVVVALHHGPQDFAAGHFDPTEAAAYAAVVNAAVSGRGLRVHTIYGHNHNATKPVVSRALGINAPGVLGPPAVDHIPGRYSVANVFPDGRLWVYSGDLNYPYP